MCGFHSYVWRPTSVNSYRLHLLTPFLPTLKNIYLTEPLCGHLIHVSWPCISDVVRVCVCVSPTWCSFHSPHCPCSPWWFSRRQRPGTRCHMVPAWSDPFSELTRGNEEKEKRSGNKKGRKRTIREMSQRWWESQGTWSSKSNIVFEKKNKKKLSCKCVADGHWIQPHPLKKKCRWKKKMTRSWLFRRHRLSSIATLRSEQVLQER